MHMRCVGLCEYYTEANVTMSCLKVAAARGLDSVLRPSVNTSGCLMELIAVARAEDLCGLGFDSQALFLMIFLQFCGFSCSVAIRCIAMAGAR